MELPVKLVLRGTPVGVLQDLQVSQKYTLFFDKMVALSLLYTIKMLIITLYTSEIKSPKTESSLKSITEINVILSSSLFKPIFVSKYNFHVKKKQLK